MENEAHQKKKTAKRRTKNTAKPGAPQSNSHKQLPQRSSKKTSASKQRAGGAPQQQTFDNDINQIQYTLPPGAENMDPQILQ